MAIEGLLSQNIYLGQKTPTRNANNKIIRHQTGTFSIVGGLQSLPALHTWGTPDKVEKTRLRDIQRTYTKGLYDLGDLTFTLLYDRATFNKVAFYEGVRDWCVIVPDGKKTALDKPVYSTTFYFQGECFAFINEIGVGEALTYTLTIYPYSEIIVYDADVELDLANNQFKCSY